jgi:hypothetical protein
MEDPVLQISLKFQRNSTQAYDCTRLMIVQDYLFRKCRRGIWLPRELSMSNSFITTFVLITEFVTRLTRRVPLVEQKLLTLPEHLSSPRFLVGFVLLDLLFICMFCRSLFVLLYFFFWPLCCLFFFDIWILITPLVSSNSSCDTDISCKCQFVNIINQIKDIKWNLSNRHISDGVARPYTRVLILIN